MARLRSPRPLFALGAIAVLSLSVACRLDMLLKAKNGSPPVLSVSPTEVRDSARAGSRDVRHTDVQITNTGAGTLTWSASDHSPWIQLDPSEGEVPGTLTISLDPGGLDPGVYQGDVTVTAVEAADTQVTTINVTFLVQRPGLSVTPQAIERSTTVNSNAVFTETLQVMNSGTGQLSWSATENRSWLSLGATSGNGNGSLPVTISTSGLVAGTYHGDIVVTASGAIGSPATVSVTLTIVSPGLAVTPGVIRDTAAPGSTTPQTDTLHIRNTGNGTLTWTATKLQPWLSLSKAAGGAPDSVTVTLSPDGLPPGTQNDTIVFTSPEATNGPVKVPVQFTIASKPCLEIAVAPDVINKAGTLDAGDCNAPHRPGSLANLYGFNANAGDTISIRLVSPQFDAYLILTNGAGIVLAQNDECPGETGTACIMDFPIPAGGHYLVEATSVQPGVMGTLSFSLVRERAPTPPTGLGQFRAIGNGNTTIGVGDTIPETEVVFKGKVDDPTESDFVRLEIELEPTVSPFIGVATQVGDFVSASGSGTQTSVRASGLTNRVGYRWQARTCDSTGRCSAWLQFGSNADTAADFTVAIP